MKKKWVSMVLTVVLALTPALPASAELQSDTGAPVREVSSVAEDDQTAGTELPELKYGEDAPDAVTLGSETGQASVHDTEEDTVIELQAVSGDYTYTVTDGEATITKYSGTEANVVVPAELDGYKVTTIGELAFSGNTTLQSVKISDGILKMDYSVFKDCTSLSSIDFGKTLTIIGGRLFENCTSLTEVTLNQDSEVELGTYMFADTPNLKKVELLGNTTLISGSTFSASSGGPKTVVFGKNVKDKYDGNGGLSSCQALENIIVDSDNPQFYR